MSDPVPERSAESAAPGTALRLAVVLLVAASGAVETISFTALDRVFAGVMTSNLALLGMAVGRAQGSAVTGAVLALGGFGLGAGVTAGLTRRASSPPAHWSGRVTACLAGEAALLGAGAGVWAALGGTPGESARNALQFGAAAAMGIQAAAMVAAGRSAAPTTYLTGTLATYIVKGVGAGRPSRWVPARLGAMSVGAGICMAVLRTAPAWAGVLPVALVACALLAARAASGPGSGPGRGPASWSRLTRRSR